MNVHSNLPYWLVAVNLFFRDFNEEASCCSNLDFLSMQIAHGLALCYK